MAHINARAAGSPIRHLVADRTSAATICGKPAKLMAKWANGEAGVDGRIWRSCKTCHEALAPKSCTCGALEIEGCFCGISASDFYATPKAARA